MAEHEQDGRATVESRENKRLRWVESEFAFRFALGSHVLVRVPYRCLVADEATTGLSGDPDAYWPDWRSIPDDVEMVVVPFQPLSTRPSSVEHRGGTIRYVGQIETHCFVELKNTFSQYMSDLSHDVRHTARRRLRRFAEAAEPNPCLREFSTPNEMEEFLQLAHEIDRRSWQGQRELGLPSESRFREQILERAKRGRARGYGLTFSGKPVAYQYCSMESAQVNFEASAYDPEFKKYSPGQVLFLGVLERLFAERRWTICDLGRLAGDDYKRNYSTQLIPCATVYFVRRTFKNHAIVWSHHVMHRSVDAVRKTMYALGLGRTLGNAARWAGISPESSCEPTAADGRPGPTVS